MVQPAKPSVIRVSTHHRRRSLNDKKRIVINTVDQYKQATVERVPRPHYQFKTKKRSNIIHVKDHLSKRTPSTDNGSINRYDNLRLIPTALKDHPHQQNNKSELSINQHSIEYSKNKHNGNSGIVIYRLPKSSQHSLITNSSTGTFQEENGSDRSHSYWTLSKSSKVNHYEDIIQDNQSHTKTIYTSSDRQATTNDHHRDRKRNKKTKCSIRRCLIACVLTALLFIVVIAIILPVLLLKSKSKSTQINLPTALLRWNSTAITVAGISGIPGIASNQLNRPYGVALDYSNSLYITDYNNNRVQKYLMGASNGSTVAGRQNGTPDASAYGLNYPRHIIVYSDNGIFVSDSTNNRIQFWANGASSGTTIIGPATSISGSSNNQLFNPFGIARDLTTGTLYIADDGNNRVVSYVYNAVSGTVVAGDNGPGLNNTQLWNPVGLYYDSLSTSLFITSSSSNNVVRWVLGANSWTLAAGNTNATAGNTSTTLNAARDVTFDPMGNMYVADTENHRIQLFMVGQTEGITIAGVTGTSGNDLILLNRPYSLTFDSQLNLYVADTDNHRIQKFLRY